MRLLIGVFVFAVANVSHSFGSVSDDKCDEYSKVLRQRRGMSDFFAYFFNIPAPDKVSTEPGEFPHMAHLGAGDEDEKIFYCGGLLISDQYVLTTATCTTKDVLLLNNRKRRSIKAQHKTEPTEDEIGEEDYERRNTIRWVQLGDNNLISNLYTVEKIIIHPDHSSDIYNDIALIKLDRKVQFSHNIRPACLFSKEKDFTNTTVIATGWGAPAFDKNLSDVLLKISLVVLTEDECNSGAGVFEIDDSKFCVGGRGTSNTLCQGDGGGPLQIKNENHDNMYDIIGLISFGYMCNVLNFPVYATRVSFYIPWIESIVWPYEK